MRHTLNQLGAFNVTVLKDLKRFMLYTFPVEDELKEKSARDLWNHMFNAAV